jgi:hypothetical protein
MFFVTSQDLGGSIVQNEAFYSEVFMNPIYHFPSFYFGFLLALVYSIHKNEKVDDSKFQGSKSGRLMELVCENSSIRYSGYILGLTLLICSILWQSPFAG